MNYDVSLEGLKLMLPNTSKEKLREMAEGLYNNYFDIRKTLDEQRIVNEKMYDNHYLYEARTYEALAKFLYVKAEIMMRDK